MEKNIRKDFKLGIIDVSDLARDPRYSYKLAVSTQKNLTTSLETMSLDELECMANEILRLINNIKEPHK